MFLCVCVCQFVCGFAKSSQTVSCYIVVGGLRAFLCNASFNRPRQLQHGLTTTANVAIVGNYMSVLTSQKTYNRCVFLDFIETKVSSFSWRKLPFENVPLWFFNAGALNGSTAAAFVGRCRGGGGAKWRRRTKAISSLIVPINSAHNRSNERSGACVPASSHL